jgi:thioredoxin 1
MKEVIFAFLIALVVGAFINGFAVSGSSGPVSSEPAVVQPGGTSSPGSAGVELPEMTDATFDDAVLKSTTPVLVDFYAQTCAPCKEMAPIFQQVAADYGDRVKVVRVDIDANPRVTAQYNVNTLPTAMIFKNGQRGESFTGLVPRGILAQTLDKALQ